MNQKELKTQYGWDEKMEQFFIDSNQVLKSEWKGSFRIKKHSNRLFWYYQLSSRVKGRDKYLCSVDITEDPNKSFQSSCMKLMEKVNTGFIISTNNKKFLHPYIDIYIESLQKELNSDGGRRVTTTNRLIRNIRDFQGFCKGNDIRLNEQLFNKIKEIKDDIE